MEKFKRIMLNEERKPEYFIDEGKPQIVYKAAGGWHIIDAPSSRRVTLTTKPRTGAAFTVYAIRENGLYYYIEKSTGLSCSEGANKRDALRKLLERAEKIVELIPKYQPGEGYYKNAIDAGRPSKRIREREEAQNKARDYICELIERMREPGVSYGEIVYYTSWIAKEARKVPGMTRELRAEGIL